MLKRKDPLVRFQIQQTRLIRLAIDKSAAVQNKLADTQEDILARSHINFELESSAKGLISLVEQADSILNTKVNIYVDILNFDNKLPHETRLFNVIDSWNQDLQHSKEFNIKFRHDRDAKVIAKYLHNVHHEIYICQSLIKNKGWVYISPYVKSITEHVEAIITLNAVKLTLRIALNKRSYMPVINAIVPPETPGTTSAAPIPAPFKKVIT